jgi:CRP-like cAMP-binding protein
MLILLEGKAEVFASSGEKLGQFGEGAAFGELAMLGLFTTRTVTVQALHHCRVFSLTAQDLFRVGLVKDACELVLKAKEEQVQRGLPLTALPIKLNFDCVGVRYLAMLAERLDLATGDWWKPSGNRDPRGPSYGVLARGRAQLELPDNQVVMKVVSGSLVPEGLVSEYGAGLRAMSRCEAYRFLEIDFMTVVASFPSAKEWLHRFRLLQVETCNHFAARLRSVRGAGRSTANHPSNDDIHNWKVRRLKAMERASAKKLAQSEGKLSFLPALDDARKKDRTGLRKVCSEPKLMKLPRIGQVPLRAYGLVA